MRRLWASALVATWASVSSRLLTVVLVLPLALHYLNAEELRFWLITNGILFLRILSDAGFSPTVSRLYAYAMGGADISGLGHQTEFQEKTSKSINWGTVDLLNEASQRLFVILAIVYFLILLGVGFWLLPPVVAVLPNENIGWACWAGFLVSQTISFLGGKYTAYLVGTNQIAPDQRLVAIIALVTTAGMVVAMLAGAGLLGLMVVGQLSAISLYVRGRVLVRRLHGGRYRDSLLGKMHADVWEIVWPRAWRSAVGHFLLTGVIQGSGIVFSANAAASTGASYLIAIRVLNVLTQFSDAPFYTKLPEFSRMRSTNANPYELSERARNAMGTGLLLYSVGFLALTFFGKTLLEMVGKDVGLPPTEVWLLLGAATFFYRYGAMHLQLYSTKNNILWHWIAAVTSVVFVSIITMMGGLTAYALSLGMLGAFGIVYAPWSAWLSHKYLAGSALKFERTALALPTVILTLACGFALLTTN